MKSTKLLLGLFVIILLGNSALSVRGALPDNLVIAMDLAHSENETDAEMLKEAYVGAGSEFEYITTWELTDDINVLLFAAPQDTFPAAHLTEIYDWFNSGGPKLIWFGTTDDYGGYFLGGNVNDILEKLDSHLRVSADAINDYVSNDGSPYRVVANKPQTDGDLNKIFNVGVSNVVFHGPGYVLGYENNAIVNLNNATIDGVEIIIKSSDTSYFKDQDNTEGPFDYYTQEGLYNGNLSVPMAAIEDMGSDKYIIAAGESTWLDVRNMYGMKSEYYNETDGFGNVEGKTFVDNILTWFGGVVSDADEDDAPIAIFSVFFALALIPIIRRKINK